MFRNFEIQNRSAKKVINFGFTIFSRGNYCCKTSILLASKRIKVNSNIVKPHIEEPP